ncbi:hypothetical protein R6Z07F_015900 [Ovis aries]
MDQPIFDTPNLVYSLPVLTILSVTSVDRKQRDSFFSEEDLGGSLVEWMLNDSIKDCRNLWWVCQANLKIFPDFGISHGHTLCRPRMDQWSWLKSSFTDMLSGCLHACESVHSSGYMRFPWFPLCIVSLEKNNGRTPVGFSIFCGLGLYRLIMDAPEFIKHLTGIRASAGFPVYKYMWVIVDPTS